MQVVGNTMAHLVLPTSLKPLSHPPMHFGSAPNPPLAEWLGHNKPEELNKVLHGLFTSFFYEIIAFASIT